VSASGSISADVAAKVPVDKKGRASPCRSSSSSDCWPWAMRGATARGT